jgi:hypothetical protein
MSEFQDNLYVPPALDNFHEFDFPEGDALEKAQTMAHELRVAIAATLEQREQHQAKVREHESAIAELNLALDKLRAS